MDGALKFFAMLGNRQEIEAERWMGDFGAGLLIPCAQIICRRSDIQNDLHIVSED